MDQVGKMEFDTGKMDSDREVEEMIKVRNEMENSSVPQIVKEEKNPNDKFEEGAVILDSPTEGNPNKLREVKQMVKEEENQNNNLEKYLDNPLFPIENLYDPISDDEDHKPSTINNIEDPCIFILSPPPHLFEFGDDDRMSFEEDVKTLNDWYGIYKENKKSWKDVERGSGTSSTKAIGKVNPTDLAADADIASALVLDTHLKFATRKVQLSFINPEDLIHEKVTKILKKFKKSQDQEKAYRRIIAVDWPNGYGRLKDGLLKEQIFHYLQIVNPESGYKMEYSSRVTYANVKVIATKFWSEGERIEGLVGSLVKMRTTDKNDLIRATDNGLSLRHSNNKKHSMLWVGPASYISHDCLPNCKFVPFGGHMACVVLTRNVAKYEELTCHYGADFFGQGNISCECSTCEDMNRGSFDNLYRKRSYKSYGGEESNDSTKEREQANKKQD